MDVERDPDTGATYWTVMRGDIARTVTITECVMVDLNAEGNVLGIELL